MTIDEAIEQERSKVDSMVKHSERHCVTQEFFANVEYHEQIAEWLEDYKRVKKWKDEIMEEFCRYDASSIEELMQRARNKAIDDFVNACKEDILCQSFGLHANGIERIVEQLKAGGIDGNERTDN